VERSISIEALPTPTGWTCNVKIEEGGKTITHHTVELTKDEQERLAPQSNVEDLIRRSFEFLLEREPPHSIMRKFGLRDIERYFPEYPRVITNPC
jgi:hypothetical protein